MGGEPPYTSPCKEKSSMLDGIILKGKDIHSKDKGCWDFERSNGRPRDFVVVAIILVTIKIKIVTIILVTIKIKRQTGARKHCLLKYRSSQPTQSMLVIKELLTA